MVAQELALAHPGRVDRLVLVATIPGGRLTAPMPLKTAYLLSWAPLLASEVRLRGFVKRALGPETARRQPRVVRRLLAHKRAHPQSERAWRAQATAGVLFDPLGRQRRITQPTLILQGTADQVVNPVNAELLANLIPDARLQLFEGAGHLLYWDEPKRFVRVVGGFLTDHAPWMPVPDRAVPRLVDAACDGAAPCGGWLAGRPRTCDRAITSRFAAVCGVPPNVIHAGRVGYVVRLVRSGLEWLCVVE
jgi:alpha/beta hydrolase family protein